MIQWQKSLKTSPIVVLPMFLVAIVIHGSVLASFALALDPTEAEASRNFLALGGRFWGENESPDRILIPYEWTGTSNDITQLKYIGGIKEITLWGITVKELVLEDLPDLEQIHLSAHFPDEKAGKSILWDSLPLTSIQLRNLPKVKSFDLNGRGDCKETQVTTLKLEKMDGLTSLMVKSANLHDGVLQSVSGAPHLKTIEASRGPYAGRGGRTQITDAAVTSIHLLHELTSLDLEGARITDAGLKSICTAKSLKTLRLNATDVTDRGIEHTASLTHLETLCLNETALTDVGLKRIAYLHPKLQDLGIVQTSVTASGLKWLNGLYLLSSLRLDSGQLSEQSCAVLSSLPVKFLQISGRSAKPAVLARLPSVRILFISDVDDLTVVPGSLAELRFLVAHRTSFEATRSLFEHLPQLHKLEVLRLHAGSQDSNASKSEISVPINDELMHHISTLKTLKAFGISGGDVELGDKGITAFAALSTLEDVSLSANTQITDEGVAVFAGLTKLKSLSLGGKRITNEALQHFRNLKQLERLDLRTTSIDPEAAARFKADYLPNVEIYTHP